MTQKLVLMAVCSGAVLCTGCATTAPQRKGEYAQVTVRFVASPEDARFTNAQPDSTGMRLVSTSPSAGFATEPTSDFDADAHHVVMWGGPFNGDDVTYAPAPLPPGSYMFGMFDPDHGSAYQGWISVNDGGDDLLSVLSAWRDTVHEQKEWLGFEKRADGTFASRNPKDFKAFQKEIKNLDRLERRINDALKAEAWDQKQSKERQAQFLRNAQVLMMPGSSDFLQPFTKSAFTEEELSSVRSGEAVTKVVVVADYAKAVERLRRVTNLRDEITRTRCVLVEEVKRLQNRRHYYQLTKHLYDHDRDFVENEKRLQKARGMIDMIDQQAAAYRQHCHALMYVAGLFSPGHSSDFFDQELQALKHDHAVADEEYRQVQRRFAQCSESSNRRVDLERDRQNAMAAIEGIDRQIGQINEARVALAKVRDSSGIIHRDGPARIMTASLIDGAVPMYLVDAVERESLMTVRLQAADVTDTPSGKTVTQSRTTETTTASRN